MISTNRWAMKLSVMALALSVMAIFWVWAVKTTPCAGAQATCPIALTRVISQGLTINEDGADSDSRLEGDTNANLQYWDAGADSIGLGAVVTAGAFETVTGYTTNRAGVTSVGREFHAPAGTFTQTNAASTTLAVGARYFIGAPTFAGANATQVLTDAFTALYDAPVAGTNMTLTRAYTMGLSAGTTGTLWVSRDTDSTTAAGGLLFGASRDTNLYRSAASTLRTDGTFNANTALLEAGNAVPNATDNLGFFAATTSAQLAGVISDETGSGGLVFATSPTITTPTIAQINGAGAAITLNPTTDVVISNNTGLIVGNTAQVTGDALFELQVLGTAIADSGMLIGRWSADANPPFLNFVKSRNATIGSSTIVQSGDDVGRITWDIDNGTNFGNTIAIIRAIVDATPGAADFPGRLQFETTADGAASPTERLRIDSNGIVYINDTSNANMTTGLTINQGPADNEAQAWKSSDVNQPTTANAEADTFGTVTKAQATSGGLQLTGYKSSVGDAGFALLLEGVLGEAADTTHSAAGLGVVNLSARVNSGTGTAAVGANGNLLTVSNAGSTAFIVDAEGDVFADGGGITVYDHERDIQLLRDLRICQTRGKSAELNAKYGTTPLTYSCAQLEALGFIAMNTQPVTRSVEKPVLDASGRQVYELRQKKDAKGQPLYEPLTENVAVVIEAATTSTPAKTKIDTRVVTQKRSVVVTKDVQIPVDGQPGRFVKAKQDIVETQDVPVDDLTRPVMEAVAVMQTITETVDSAPFWNVTATGRLTMDALRQLAEDTDASIANLQAQITSLQAALAEVSNGAADVAQIKGILAKHGLK